MTQTFSQGGYEMCLYKTLFKSQLKSFVRKTYVTAISQSVMNLITCLSNKCALHKQCEKLPVGVRKLAQHYRKQVGTS